MTGQHNRDNGKNRGRGRNRDRYQLSGIPWPTLGDGEPYILKGDNQPFRVRHAELTDETGQVQWVEWCHPEGEHMAERMTAATKTREAKAKPGAWWAVVAWDGRDDSGREPILARHPLVNLETE